MPIMPESHYLNVIQDKAQEVADNWMNGNLSDAKLAINALTPIEAGLVVMFAYIGFAASYRDKFARFIGFAACEAQQELRPMVDNYNPFRIEKIDDREYALYMDQGERWKPITTVEASSGVEARDKCAQMIARMIYLAPDRAEAK